MRAMFARRWRQSPSRATRAALLVEAVIDALRNAPALHWDILRQDVVFAGRAMRRAPALSVTVVLVTAIGIGATTAAFSLADHVLIRPLPFQDPDRLVKVWQMPPGGRLEASPANFRDWKTQAASFEGVAAFTEYSANLIGAGDPLRLDGAWVTGDLFSVLGVSPLAGRTTTADDSRETAPPTVVLSERLWHGRFAADPRIIGATVTLNDGPRVVIGVMPRSFEFPSRVVDFWVPLQLAPGDYIYGNPYLKTVARLKPGVSVTQALGDVRRIARQTGFLPGNGDGRISADVILLRDELSPQSRLLLWCLLAAAAGLLLIACTNLANLFMTRGLARSKELAVRTALGAGRHRLVRQMFTESLLLAFAGGAAGIVVAAATIPTVARLVPTTLPIAEVPAVDVRLLAVATAVTLFSSLSIGLLPAMRSAPHADAAALRDGARSSGSRRTDRLRSVLVVAQVGASVVLLVSCGLLLRAMLTVQATAPGFVGERVLTVRTALPWPKYNSVARRHEFFDRVLGDVRALPGVSSAAYITGLPLAMRGMIWSVAIPGQPQIPSAMRTVSIRFVTPGFFAAMGIPILRGRDVADSDTQSARFVAVVSESFARRYWPDQDAIGRRFTPLGALREQERTVVGIVGDVRWRGLERNSEPQMYLSSRQINDGALINHVPKELVVRGSVDPTTLVPAIRSSVARADPQQPVSDIQLVSDIVDAETAPRRVQVRVLGGFAVIAFLLAGLGLHGLLAYNVSQRAREIGVRLALGADRRSILMMVLRHGFTLALVGMAIGTAGAAAAARTLHALLAGVSPSDFATFGSALALAALMTAAGSLLPAIRAVRVDPLVAMRDE
jgi:predicted permease